ncbi:MAG TPA: outer membrane protein assembly factor BamD [Dongiaceae bacterium]|jgi:outer membrane protein assembly factor BamD
MPDFARPLPVLALAFIAGLAGCAAGPPPQVPDTPPENLYNQASNALDQGQDNDAAKLFEEVQRQHPYSALEPQSEIMAAYAYYRSNKYDDAIGALNHFIELHPGNKNTAYAYYLKALCYYEQIEDVRRDQKVTQQALDALNEVVNRYPASAYARDAKLKIDLTRDHLAGKEMDIGRYYEGQKLYLAAINRFRTVIEKYQTTSHTPEALERLTECYLALGVNEEAQTAAAVLGYNYPGTSWYQASFDLLKGKNLKPEKSSGSWLSNIF